MAKKGGKSKGYISAGTHSNVSASTRREMRAAIAPTERLMNKFKAWKAGKNVKVTVETGDPTKPFVRVSGDDYFGKGKPAKEIMPYMIRGTVT